MGADMKIEIEIDEEDFTVSLLSKIHTLIKILNANARCKYELKIRFPDEYKINFRTTKEKQQ